MPTRAPARLSIKLLYAAFLGGTFYLRKFLNRFWTKRK